MPVTCSLQCPSTEFCLLSSSNYYIAVMCLQEDDHRGKVVISSYQGYKLSTRLVLLMVTLITCPRSRLPAAPAASCPPDSALPSLQSHHRQPTLKGWGTFYLPEGRAATEAIWNCSPLEIYLLCPHLLIPSLIYMRTDSMGIYCILYYSKILLISYLFCSFDYWELILVGACVSLTQMRYP